WRCLSCIGQPQYCTSCMRDTHQRLPFHQVEIWTSPDISNGFYTTASLADVGVKINLGHDGSPCP
ncbi:hypothetical protein BDN72DRAFT_739955, partial [Pluteus cervinus]